MKFSGFRNVIVFYALDLSPTFFFTSLIFVNPFFCSSHFLFLLFFYLLFKHFFSSWNTLNYYFLSLCCQPWNMRWRNLLWFYNFTRCSLSSWILPIGAFREISYFAIGSWYAGLTIKGQGWLLIWFLHHYILFKSISNSVTTWGKLYFSCGFLMQWNFPSKTFWSFLIFYGWCWIALNTLMKVWLPNHYVWMVDQAAWTVLIVQVQNKTCTPHPHLDYFYSFKMSYWHVHVALVYLCCVGSQCPCLHYLVDDSVHQQLRTWMFCLSSMTVGKVWMC